MCSMSTLVISGCSAINTSYGRPSVAPDKMIAQEIPKLAALTILRSAAAADPAGKYPACRYDDSGVLNPVSGQTIPFGELHTVPKPLLSEPHGNYMVRTTNVDMGSGAGVSLIEGWIRLTRAQGAVGSDGFIECGAYSARTVRPTDVQIAEIQRGVIRALSALLSLGVKVHD